METRLLLVDGNSLINRAYYGLGGGRAGLTLDDGTPTGAVFGFMNTLLKQMDEYAPTHIAIAFDTPEKTFRHKLDPDYKGNRKGMDDELAVQVPLLKTLLDDMGIYHTEKPGYEADDIIGTVSKQIEDEGGRVYILSGDRDELQLLSDRVHVLYPKGRGVMAHYDPERFEEEYGFAPPRLVDYKAICGDSSDNIKGVRGIGDKGAKALLADYDNLEVIYSSIDEVKKTWRTKLVEHEDDAKRSYELAMIDREVPLEPDEAAMRFPGLIRPETLEGLKKLKFDSIIDRYAIGRKVREHTADTRSEDDTHDDVVTGQRELPGLARETLSGEALADAVEAQVSWAKDMTERGAMPWMAAVWHRADTSADAEADDAESAESTVWLSFRELPKGREGGPAEEDPSTEDDSPLPRENLPEIPCFPLPSTDGDAADGEDSALRPEDPVLWKLTADDARDVLERLLDAGVRLTGHHLHDLFRGLAYFPLDGTFDTRVAAYLLNMREGEQSPGALAAALGPDVLRYGEGRDDLGDDERLALMLPIMTARLGTALRKMGLEYLAYAVEFPLVAILAGMEARGVAVDRAMLEELDATFSARAETLSEEIEKLAGRSFNVNSPKQLSEVLFEDLKLPGGRKTSSGNYSTAADEMERLRPLHPIIDLILEYRQMTKLNSTFVAGLAQEIDPEDGRVHTTYHQTLTATGRLSSSDPNLQNIPIRTEEGRQIRKAFVPADGKEFLDADYSQIELRLLAHISGDESMREAFNEGRDIHRTTAAKIFGLDDAREVTADQRAAAKTVNFSIVYGISDYGLSRDLGITVKEAHDYIRGYYAQYPGVERYMDDIVASAEETGYVDTMFGRRRPVPELKAKNYNTRQFGKRVAMNSPIQGAAADIMKIAMVRTERALRKQKLDAAMILQVHDELILEVAPEDAGDAAELLRTAMEEAVDLSIPLVADVSHGLSWYDTDQ